MCGIIGSINKSYNLSALKLIEHRGPDASEIETFKVAQHDIRLGLVRLAIVELSDAGRQPMISSCGKFAITFNGEIYNHLDLREKLKEVEFKGHSDTETILYYLKKFGIDSVVDFNGIFGFSFLDIENEKLYLARDHFGVKPVYYFQDEKSFIFSSEIRPVKNLQDNPEPDFENLPTLLRLRYLPSPLTLHKNIQKLKPGHYIEVDLTSEKLHYTEKYFVKEQPLAQTPRKGNALKGYETYIENAVKRQLMADVEIGVLLSGGVDSAVVAAIAQKHSDKKLKAFTIGFEGLHKEDEIDAAKETAEILGLEHFSKKINFDNFLSIFEETTRIIEEPLATTSVIPMYYLSQLASKHVKVVLTGQGADEPLGGYQRYQGEVISEKIPRGLIHSSNKLIPHIGIKNERLLRSANALGERDDVQRFLNVYSIFTQNDILKLLNVKEDKAFGLISYFYETLNCERKKTAAERMMAIDVRMNLPDDLLLYTDKITMNFSLECRVPMLDTELIKYIESLPAKERLAIRKTKIIHKEYAKKILPERIINRKKFAFQSPTKIWFKNYNEQILELLLKPSPFTEIFNKEAIKNVLDEHLKGYNREKQIFLLLSIYYWLQDNK
ncbi:asparagine synthase (glutamine-hydrolyzing) [Aequorivita sp. CIP111184]|uniref:asparagine synthase (glutamine-hydrolyzing) n=1 Tax=Aequorivita sp. CIP111184 TaxID=2211356 RepID=UPI000DBC0274|nr:asparagine synthase (glutamine-hydrolyzing) [Aequorivita sp. CIP111184]SRX52633.1 Asparagine synthetase [glutamine-hydrolyzing] 1 [Aequorivita sp. CIP111184]